MALMANRPAKITQTEISRTFKAAAEAGVIVGRYEVDHRAGKVIVWPAGSAATDGVNPCDELLS
jgi:hypothetical protein